MTNIFKFLNSDTYQIKVDGGSKCWIVINGNNDSTVAHDGDDHVNNTERYFQGGYESQGRRTRTPVVSRVIVLAEVEFENVNRRIQTKRVPRSHGSVKLFDISGTLHGRLRRLEKN